MKIRLMSQDLKGLESTIAAIERALAAGWEMGESNHGTAILDPNGETAYIVPDDIISHMVQRGIIKWEGPTN